MYDFLLWLTRPASVVDKISTSSGKSLLPLSFLQWVIERVGWSGHIKFLFNKEIFKVQEPQLQAALLTLLASADAPQLHPLQLPLANCVGFSCSSPIAFTSVAAPQVRPLQLLLPDCVHFNCCSPIGNCVCL